MIYTVGSASQRHRRYPEETSSRENGGGRDYSWPPDPSISIFQPSDRSPRRLTCVPKAEGRTGTEEAGPRRPIDRPAYRGRRIDLRNLLTLSQGKEDMELRAVDLGRPITVSDNWVHQMALGCKLLHSNVSCHVPFPCPLVSKFMANLAFKPVLKKYCSSISVKLLVYYEIKAHPHMALPNNESFSYKLGKALSVTVEAPGCPNAPKRIFSPEIFEKVLVK